MGCKPFADRGAGEAPKHRSQHIPHHLCHILNIPAFPSSWVRAGTHEVNRELVQRAIRVPEPGYQPHRQILLVDSRVACAAEAGELIEAGVTGSQVV